ncbi:MAG: hypothetical protein V1836_03690 [Candidatus Aenigmatarchaeota archaeon]
MFQKRRDMVRKLKGDIWFVSDFLFLVSLFSVSMIMLFSMSIAKLIVGNLIDYTVHAQFLEFSLNNENALLSGSEIKINPSDPQLKRIMSFAAFQWNGDPICGSPPVAPCWDGNVFIDGVFYNVNDMTKGIFDKLVGGPYVLELRKNFNGVDKRFIIASRDADNINADPEVAELEFAVPYSSPAFYRLYSVIK